MQGPNNMLCMFVGVARWTFRYTYDLCIYRKKYTAVYTYLHGNCNVGEAALSKAVQLPWRPSAGNLYWRPSGASFLQQIYITSNSSNAHEPSPLHHSISNIGVRCHSSAMHTYHWSYPRGQRPITPSMQEPLIQTNYYKNKNNDPDEKFADSLYADCRDSEF